MSTDLPHSARVAWTVTAWLRGHVPGDDVVAELGDPDHVLEFVDAATGGVLSATDLLLVFRRAGVDGAGLAMPVEGDPVGLGGPPPFNLAAMEAGEAVVVGATAVVPSLDGGMLRWEVHACAPRQLVDTGEADRTLRRTVQEVAQRLADLDVARWRPEVADELISLATPAVLEAPPGTPAACVRLAGHALQAAGIVALTRVDDGGAVTAWEAAQRSDALAPLAAAARRALVAACSAEVWPPSR